MSWLLIIHAYFYVLPPFWMIYTADLTALKFVLLVWEHKQVCTNFNILSYGFCGLIKNIWFIYCFHWLILYVCLNLHKLVSIKIFHVFNPSLTFNRKSCRELRSLDPRLPKPKPPFCASQSQSIIVEHIQRVHILVITPKWMYNGKRKKKISVTYMTDWQSKWGLHHLRWTVNLWPDTENAWLFPLQNGSFQWSNLGKTVKETCVFFSCGRQLTPQTESAALFFFRVSCTMLQLLADSLPRSSKMRWWCRQYMDVL